MPDEMPDEIARFDEAKSRLIEAAVTGRDGYAECQVLYFLTGWFRGNEEFRRVFVDRVNDLIPNRPASDPSKQRQERETANNVGETAATQS